MTKPSVRDYVRILLKRKWTVVITLVSAVVFTVLGLQFKVPEFEGRVKLMMTAGDGVAKPVSTDSSPADTECEVITTYPIMRRAVEEVGYHVRPKYYVLDYCSKLSKPVFKGMIDLMEKINRLLEDPNARDTNPEIPLQKGVAGLMNCVKVKPITNTDLYAIYVLDYDAKEAARIANTISRIYVLFSLKRRLADLTTTLDGQNPNILELRSLIAQMDRNLDSPALFKVERLGFSSVKIVEAALPPLRAKGLPKVILVILAAVGGTVLGFVLVFVFERYDDTVRGPDDVRGYFNLAMVGSIPKTHARKYRYHRESNTVRIPKKAQLAYENLAAEIHLTLQEKQLKLLHIASGLPNAEVSPIVAALGAAMAAVGKTRVLILDANLRNPTLGRLFGATPESHWDAFLDEQAPMPVAQKITETLALLPGAPCRHTPAAVYHSEKLKRFLEECRNQYDVILFNSPSLKRNHDGVVLSTLADAVVLVINEGQERRQAVAATVASLQSKKVTFLGVILNNRKFVIPQLLIKWL